MIPKHHQDLFATIAFPAQGLSAILALPGKGSCRHHRFARALARCHYKQWVPGRLIGLGVRSFRLNILHQIPIFVMNCENNGFLIINAYDLSISNIYFKKIIKLGKHSSFNCFSRVNHVIHTNSRHNTNACIVIMFLIAQCGSYNIGLKILRNIGKHTWYTCSDYRMHGSVKLRIRSSPRAQTSAAPSLRSAKQFSQAWNSLANYFSCLYPKNFMNQEL